VGRAASEIRILRGQVGEKLPKRRAPDLLLHRPRLIAIAWRMPRSTGSRALQSTAM